MSLFLQVIGIIFLVIIGIIVLLVIVIRTKWKSIKQMLAVGAQPSTIHLVEDDSPEWLNSENVQQQIRQMEELGFIPGKTYTIEEMPGVTLLSLFHRQDEILATLYRHDIAGVWVDFVVEYEDGTELTVSNAPYGEEIDTRPEVTKIIQKEFSIQQLYSEVKSRWESKPKITSNLQTFKQIFEEAYKRDMVWRNERGGITEDEVRRVAAKDGDRYTEEVIDTAMLKIKIDEIYKWHDECIQQFIKESTLSVADWERYRELIFVVSNQMHPKAFVEYVSCYLNLEDDEIEYFRELASQFRRTKELFDRINASLSEEQNGKKLGSVSFPIDADMYTRFEMDIE